MKEKKIYLPVALKVAQLDDSDVITSSTSFLFGLQDDCTQDDIFS